MYNPIPHLPKRFVQLINQLKQKQIHHKVLFFVIGFLATLWFLIRVIPKPSRAAYPCMKATAPFMSSFVIYILSLGSAAITFKHFRQSMLQSKYLLALVLLVSAATLYLVSATSISLPAQAKNATKIKGTFPPNEPIGEAKGIFQGRVTWMRNTNATNDNCTNTSNNNGAIDEGDDAWFMAHNNNSLVIDSMINKSLLAISGANAASEAWGLIFQYYNQQHGQRNQGYTEGEKILLKINATTAYGGLATGRYDEELRRNDDLTINPFSAETNPYVVLSLLRQLVEQAGVPQEMIFIGDPARNIYQDFYSLWHDEFPLVNYLGNNLIHPELDILALGRLPVTVTETDRFFYSDQGAVMPDALSDKLFTIFDEIDYLINIPTLKAHATGGITLAAKNHFGSFTRSWAMHLHAGLMDNIDDPIRLGYGLYRVQTDIMMHKLLGGKNLLMLVDGLYPGEDALGVPEKWQSAPFNDDWCSSIFMSLDPVAIESVCHDFLRTEYNGPTIPESRPNWDGVDDYLHQAADSLLWPAEISYDPDDDGIIISSLGVHEHWNNPNDKAYTRNLGTGEGIELLQVHETTIGLGEQVLVFNIQVYPNPVKDILRINNLENKTLKYHIFNSAAKLCFSGELHTGATYIFDFGDLASGKYFLQLTDGSSHQNHTIIKP
ncbi:MAG: DUF362 domain-containing protein [Bacteroidetes bacterium]|jgi:hypothetical protein|nr:DUF362 domain-containing protein [Bacteroidota bacterium]